MSAVTNLDEHRPGKGPDFFADKIRRALGKSVAGFIEAGRWLETAKNDKSMQHGQWLPMLESIPLGANMAQRLMKIADHEVISNTATSRYLPPSRETLYELTKLPTPLLEAKIEDGTINPDITNKEARALLRDAASHSKKKPSSKKKSGTATSDKEEAGETSNSIDAAIDALVAAIANESDKQKVQIIVTVCERAKVFPGYIYDESLKRSEERGEVEYLDLTPVKPKKRS